MRIALIDDERYARVELKHHIREWDETAYVKEAASGVEALELFEKEHFDLLFIDIHLGDMEGTTLAAYAKKMMPEARIVFATAFSEYAVRAFELQADDYLLKPIDPERIRAVLEKCAQAKPEAPLETSARIALSSARHTTLIDVAEISHILTDGVGRGCYLFTRHGKKHRDSASLSDFEAKLREHGFYRIHKSALVNLRQIQDIFPWKNNGLALRMKGFDAQLPIGREKVRELKRLLQI